MSALSCLITLFAIGAGRIWAQNCIQKANMSPNVRERFSDGALSRLCRREEEWNRKSLDSLGRSLDDILSPTQVTWLDAIQTCDFLCVCKQVPICAKLLESFGSLISGNIGEGLGELTSELGNLGSNRENPLPGGKGLSGLIDSFSSLSGRRRRRKKRDVINVKRRVKRQLNALRQQLPAVRRKEYRMLTDQERQNFHTQINRLKNERVDGMSKFDILVVYHRAENSPGAHFGPAFLPFHRELLKHLEMALRLQDPTVALPYWDSTLDDGLPDPAASVIWTQDFLGNGKGEVNSGPFSTWRTLDNQKARDISPNLRLFRDLGKNQFGSLLKKADVDKVMAAGAFRDLTFCIDPFFELVHGAVHMWVGGYMDPLELSPNDPVFFMLHTHVDQLWDTWRRRKQTPQRRVTAYPTNREACNNFHYADAIMKPFKITNMEGLKDQDELFLYDPSPTCSFQNPSCGSPYLFCDVRSYVCKSKVVNGADCRGFDSTGICLGGQCERGRCVQRAPPPPPTFRVTTPRSTLPPLTRPITTRAWTVRTFRFTEPTTTRRITTRRITTTTRRPRPITTRRPRTTTTTPVQFSRSSDTVWFPITVQTYQGRFVSPATAAVITARDLATGETYQGTVSAKKDYPYFPGSAFAQVPNPATKHVDAELEVRMPDGSKCTSLCLSKGTIYVTCAPRVSLDSDPAQSDPIPFTSIQEQAPFLNWDDGPLRNPDPYLFLCTCDNATQANQCPPDTGE